MPKKAHLGAPQILKFSCLCSGTHMCSGAPCDFLQFLRTRGAGLLAHPRSFQDRPYSANWFNCHAIYCRQVYSKWSARFFMGLDLLARQGGKGAVSVSFEQKVQ